MPITWKSVSGSSGAGNAAVGAKLFEQSREAMNDGFGGLRDLLRQNQATDLANWDQVKENNTNAALDKLYQYASPEAYAAAQASGQLAVDPAYGAQVDARAVRNAAEARLGILQNAAMDTQKYKDVQTEVAARPLLDQYYALKTPQERAAFRAQYDLGLNEGQLADAEQTQQLALNQDSRAATELGLRQQTTASTLRNDKLNYDRLVQQATDDKTTRQIDDMVGDFNVQLDQRDQEVFKGLSTLATSIGIPLNPTTGEPDIDKMDPVNNPGDKIKLAAYKAKADELGLTGFNPAEERKAFVQKIGADYGNRFAEVAVKGTSNAIPTYKDMTEQERAVVDREKNKVESVYAQRKADLDARTSLNSLANTNPDAFKDTKAIEEMAKGAATTDAEVEQLKETIQEVRATTDPWVLNLAVSMVSGREESSSWNFLTEKRDDQLLEAIALIEKDPSLKKQITEAQAIQKERIKFNADLLKKDSELAGAEKNAIRSLGYNLDNSGSLMGKLETKLNAIQEYERNRNANAQKNIQDVLKRQADK